MTGTPFFSIIIPSYNRKHLVGETIDTVLTQSFQDFEIIVIDDGSTDGTGEVFTDTHPKVHYFYQENQGIAGARNAGINHASGQYYCYLDSDDLWHEDKLQETHQLIQSHPDIDVIFHNFRKHDIQLERPYQQTNTDLFPYILEKLKARENNYWSGDNLTFLNLVMKGYPIYPSTLTVRSDVHINHIWDTYVGLSEDLNMAMRLALKYRIIYLHKDLATIRVHGGNISADSITHNRNVLKSMESFTEMYCSGDVKKQARQIIASRYYQAGRRQFRNRHYIASIKFLIRAMTNIYLYTGKFHTLRP